MASTFKPMPLPPVPVKWLDSTTSAKDQVLAIRVWDMAQELVVYVDMFMHNTDRYLAMVLDVKVSTCPAPAI